MISSTVPSEISLRTVTSLHWPIRYALRRDTDRSYTGKHVMQHMQTNNKLPPVFGLFNNCQLIKPNTSEMNTIICDWKGTFIVFNFKGIHNKGNGRNNIMEKNCFTAVIREPFVVQTDTTWLHWTFWTSSLHLGNQWVSNRQCFMYDITLTLGSLWTTPRYY